MKIIEGKNRKNNKTILKESYFSDILNEDDINKKLKELEKLVMKIDTKNYEGMEWDNIATSFSPDVFDAVEDVFGKFKKYSSNGLNYISKTGQIIWKELEFGSMRNNKETNSLFIKLYANNSFIEKDNEEQIVTIILVSKIEDYDEDGNEIYSYWIDFDID